MLASLKSIQVAGVWKRMANLYKQTTGWLGDRWLVCISRQKLVWRRVDSLYVDEWLVWSPVAGLYKQASGWCGALWLVYISRQMAGVALWLAYISRQVAGV